MTDAPRPLVFDHNLVKRHFDRAGPGFSAPLFEDAATQLKERLEEIKRSFAAPLDLSPAPFLSGAMLPSSHFFGGALPYAPESFDLVASNLALHWINDLPETLAQIHKTLKPGGLFVASLFGGQTLHELRECLLDAEIEVSGGASPRISPMIELRTAGDLLRRANFTLPVADIETVTVLYEDMLALMLDLRRMAQTNARVDRLRRFTSREVFFRAEDLYEERFSTPEGLVKATFDIIYLHGWK